MGLYTVVINLCWGGGTVSRVFAGSLHGQVVVRYSAGRRFDHGLTMEVEFYLHGLTVGALPKL